MFYDKAADNLEDANISPQSDEVNDGASDNREENVFNAGWESEEKEDTSTTEMIKPDTDFFFEGAEKLLEVWFTTKNRASPECDLRSIPR